MKNIIWLLIICFLAGCKIQDGIHTEIANKEAAIQVANKEKAINVEKDAVHIEKDAVHVEKEAIHIEKDAMHVESDAVGHIEEGAVKIEQGAVNIQGTVQEGAVQLPMTVQSGAVQMPLTTNVAEGAVKVNLELKIEPGAIVIKGVEPGGIQTQIETPWWAWIIMGLLGIGWLITKFRKNNLSKEITRDMRKDSILDIFF